MLRERIKAIKKMLNSGEAAEEKFSSYHEENIIMAGWERSTAEVLFSFCVT